ncbi:AbrB/MazE/SpoVT family DNA-binding domain-containing protein [Fundicoccus sp. Sow4_D5]|uniref:AbrB/MazE/SpoVT family DNA-binding domain-containing protein n=1 Tax=Fundicoccus sp. Sow4_D5 TaxID=3438782 RepID=UPI003F91DF5B
MTQLQIKKWGNSSAIRFPKELLRQVGFENNSLIEVEIVENKLVLQKVTKHQSIHDLFKDYKGGSFKSELVEFEPVGNELW